MPPSFPPPSQGIPPTCRTWVWMETSGAGRKKAGVASNYYQIMVAAGDKSSCLAEIQEVREHRGESTYRAAPFSLCPSQGGRAHTGLHPSPSVPHLIPSPRIVPYSPPPPPPIPGLSAYFPLALMCASPPQHRTACAPTPSSPAAIHSPFRIGLRAHLSPPSPAALHPSSSQDCAHTFPAHPWLASEDGQAALKRVLAAYSMHNDKVRRWGELGQLTFKLNLFTLQ